MRGHFWINVHEPKRTGVGEVERRDIAIITFNRIEPSNWFDLSENRNDTQSPRNATVYSYNLFVYLFFI